MLIWRITGNSQLGEVSHCQRLKLGFSKIEHLFYIVCVLENSERAAPLTFKYFVIFLKLLISL